MALAYLLDPCQQYQNRAGVNNVDGWFEVFRSDTDDHATVYTDFNGTLAPERIGIDNNGRAVMIVDSAMPYRVEMHDRTGNLLFTQYPVWTQKSGGGVTGTDVISSDGSIDVQSYNVGSTKTFDLSAHVEDSADLLGWIRTEGYDIIPSNIYKPRYAAGNLYVGDYGVQLDAGQYYHVTAHIKCTKVNTGALPWTDDVQVHFKGRDRTTGEYVVYKTFKVNVDYSMMLPEEYDLSLDVKAETDVDLVVVIDDKEVTGGGFQLTDMEIHRVYSGSPHLPGGVATKPWVENTYQEKLTAGAGITIDSDNVISSDGAGYTAGDGIVIDDHEISVDPNYVQETLSAGTGIVLENNEISVDTTAIQEKLTAGSNIVIDGNTISATAEPQLQADWTEADTESVQYIQHKPQNLVQDASYVHTDNNFTTALKDKLDGIESGAEVNVQADWTEADSTADSYIQHKPNLATVATSGSYTDLSNTPSIPVIGTITL